MKYLRAILYFGFLCMHIKLSATELDAGCSRSNIYVYSGSGAAQECIDQSIDFFKKVFPHLHVLTIDAPQVQLGDWRQRARLFVMPGGVGRQMREALGKNGNDVLIDYVSSGGTYVGFCAGGYYGSGETHFAKDTPEQRIIDTDQLPFFPGICEGPLVPYDYTSNAGARLLKINTEGGEITGYYNGGGHFVDADQYSNVTTLGRYEDGRAAIVQCTVAKGHAVLSGPHLEYCAGLFLPEDLTDPYLEKIILALAQDQKKREVFMHSVLLPLVYQRDAPLDNEGL